MRKLSRCAGVAVYSLERGERAWLDATLRRFDGGYPTQEQIWQLVDDACEVYLL